MGISSFCLDYQCGAAAAGKGIDAALGVIQMVDNIQFQSALPTHITCAAAALQVILPTGHFPQSQVGPLQNPVEESGLVVGFQHDLFLAGKIAVGRFGESLHQDKHALHGRA